MSLFSMLILAATNFEKAPALNWQSKVDHLVLHETNSTPLGEVEFIVFMAEQADLTDADSLKTKLEKGTYVFEKLREIAERTQKPVTTELGARGVVYRPYWIANVIWVRGDMDAIQAMAQRADVAHLYANPKVQLREPEVEISDAVVKKDGIEWNLQMVNADDVWAAGYTGQGVVIGGQDTGYDWDHPALINQYRGWDGSTADHNYDWHDAIHSGGGSCGPDSPEPCDDGTHGTHTMGIMVGDDGEGNQIGMAPGAKWIACRNMDQGVGSPATYIECYQWFLAPTDMNDQSPRPDLAPDVINNSWACPVSEGCTEPDVLLTVVNNVRAAGIMTVHSAGNEGASGCGSINTPAAIYDSSFTVGNTTSNDVINNSSSRGPVSVDGSGRLKPDISAPGTNIWSSIPGENYGWKTGTSMASPHVAGMAALLISAQPNLAGRVDEIEELIQQTADPLQTFETCGGTAGQIPNNVYGWGRIDSFEAMQNLSHTFNIQKTASAPYIEPGETLTYTIEITHLHTITDTNSVVLTDTIPVGTKFITATVPHGFDGVTIRWDFESLEANQTLSVDLLVRVLLTATGTVDNINYGVTSDDLVEMVAGEALSILVGHHSYLPIIYYRDH